MIDRISDTDPAEQPTTRTFRSPERVVIRAESLGQEFAMSFARINAHPGRYGNLGLMLVDVQPPFDERKVPREAIYYVDDDISTGNSFTLRLGHSGITRAFRALETDPVSEVA